MARQLTDLEKQIIEMAVLNPAQFIQLIGEDALLRMKICLLRQNGKSYGAISQKLDVTIDTARWNCNKCEVKS